MADDPALRAALVARDSAAITALLELHGARLGVTESALLTPEFGASVADAPILRQATDVVADSVDPRPATRDPRPATRDPRDPDLAQKFELLRLKHQVLAHAFCLEITESATMDDPERALTTLNGLSSLAFGLSIDDFGTGYSSLAYLKRLPVDELKIDKSFILNMQSDPDDAKIVRSTIDLAHNLGLRVVAEGVESAQVWNLLRDLDCDQAQGHHMGRPMPATEFHTWRAARYAG